MKQYTHIMNSISELQQQNVALHQQISDLQQYSNAVDKKGICIDDTSVAYIPESHYPMIQTDTFPSTWPNSSYPVSSMSVFSYSRGNVPANQWVLWAIQNDIKVLIGINLQDCENDLNALSECYLNADHDLKQKFDKNILAYSIGNEEGVDEIDDMKAGIDYARNLINNNQLPDKPVSTVLSPTSEWIIDTFQPKEARFTAYFMQLDSHMDIIMFNVYGGYYLYDHDLLDASLSWTSNGKQHSVILNEFGAIRSAMKKQNIQKELWITETGWSSSHLEQHEPPGWSSQENQNLFYNNFLNFNMNVPYLPEGADSYVMPPDRIFWFSLRDSYYTLLGIDEYFGLYAKQDNPLIEKV